MGLLNRPYIGTYVPNKRKVVQYTPDALVYLNGDTAMAGCRTCRSRIDIQQFVTSVSVDAGVEPGASSSSISLSIPRHYGDSLLRDGNTILRNGLEVHIYIRGYFPMTGLADEGETVAGIDLRDLPQYPYYPVFHGVVTSVSHEYSSGYYTASLSCSGMLHFWQYMMIASNGAAFGARPDNSAVRPNLRGHIYTGMSPFSIIYSLYRDTAGAAAGVGFALQSRTNYRANSSATGDSLYSMTLRYWETRFMNGSMYRLRMHGASGTLFSASQQAYLARLNAAQLRFIGSVSGPRSSRGARSVAEVGQALGILDLEEGRRVRIARGADLLYLSSSGGRRDYGVNVAQMQAFVNDISQYGQVNFFETTYESKLDIATQVSNICGYEFYQDMDGDLVFKPPLYNLDTSSSRVYRIEPEDVISISFTENEPEATYMICKGGPFQNMRGAVDEAEWGVRSTYIDYRLVAQFGWREGTFESNYYNNARSAYWAAVANLDRVNKGVNSCSITIPIRPEIRQGFPVYISSIDCFYYVESVSHSVSFGSSATTTLNLVARRRKFLPPGNPSENIDGVRLDNTISPPRALQYLDNAGMPRLLGFPNVVMALDPTRINPLFFVVGFLAEESSLLEAGRSRISAERRDLFLSNFVIMLWGASLLSVGTRSENDGISESPRRPDSEEREDVVLRGPWFIPSSGDAGREITYDNLRNALTNLIQIRGRARTRLNRIDAAISEAQERLFVLQARTGSSDTDIAAQVTLIDRLSQERLLLSQFLNSETLTASERLGSGYTEFQSYEQFFQRLEEVQTNTLGRRNPLRTGDSGLLRGVTNAERDDALLVDFLIVQLRDRNPLGVNRDMFLDETGTINNTAGILELLSDRKAAGGVNTPGYYRYYSASHYQPNEQGYVDLESAAAEEASDLLRTRDRTRDADSASSTRGAAPVSPLQAELNSYRQLLSDVESGSFAFPPELVVDARRRIAELEAHIASSTGPETREVERATLRTAEDAARTTVDIRVVTVTPFSDEEAEGAGIPSERRNDFVSLVDRDPVKGLNVRTFINPEPTPTPSSQIFALCFESRNARRFERYVRFLISNVARAPNWLRNCIGDSATDSRPGSSIAASLANAMYARLSPADKTNLGITGGDLVTRACAGITGIVGPDRTPLSGGDYAGGNPTNRATRGGDITSAAFSTLSGVTAATLEAAQRETLLNKANALSRQLGYAYRTQLNRAIQILGGEGTEVERKRQAGAAVAGYFGQARRLFAGGRADFGGIIEVQRGSGVERSSAIEQYSPVYPVSDARGYDHYGTYQYGRGLSIEEGGNYQRLMSLDPFQYVDPALADQYVTALQSARGNSESRELLEVLSQVAAQLQNARGSSPVADAFLLQFRNDGIDAGETGDETAMIAVGLRNYVMSNRDSVTKLPVANAAFLLADLQPFDRLEACDCRGAEADLSLAAYVAGVETNTFVSIGDEAGSPTSDNVAQNWVKQQMLLAADSWVLSQAALRGMTQDRGRGSLFDSVRGILGLGGNLVNSATGVDEALSNAIDPRVNQLNRIAETTVGSFNRLGDL